MVINFYLRYYYLTLTNVAITQRTAEEAKVYITESVKHWEEIGESKKIISLANFAEKWRSNTSLSTKIKAIKKSIKGVELILKRNEKIGLNSPNLVKSLEGLNNEYNKLVKNNDNPKDSENTDKIRQLDV